MSSSNQVRVTLIEETAYGITPLAGNFDTVRFTSESLSGTPETTESAQIRTDRASSGQVVTGLTLGGDFNFEMAKENVLDKLLSSAMLNDWVISAPVSVDLDLDSATKTITRATGDFNTDTVVGDILTLTGFADSKNNTQVMVVEIVSPTVVRVIGPDSLVDEVGAGTTFKVADKLTVGTTQKSFSMEKKFLDLADKGVNYKGMLVNSLSLNVGYGEIINGTFSFVGNGYKPVDTAIDFITNARTINPAATTNSMNGSIDMPFIGNSSTGSFDQTTFCIQSVSLELNNNFTAQNCIGLLAAKRYTDGTANISTSISAYLADDNWNFLAKKLSQEPFALGFMVKNLEGWYGFYIPAVQVSFDDPSSGGQNQDVTMEMSGGAKVGSNGESPITIFRS